VQEWILLVLSWRLYNDINNANVNIIPDDNAKTGIITDSSLVDEGDILSNVMLS
jgi:hypothetical protein